MDWVTYNDYKYLLHKILSTNIAQLPKNDYRYIQRILKQNNVSDQTFRMVLILWLHTTNNFLRYIFNDEMLQYNDLTTTNLSTSQKSTMLGKKTIYMYNVQSTDP